MTLDPSAGEERPRVADLRVGLIGAGMIARPHASAWLACAAEVTLYSPQDGAPLAERYGLATVESLEELFARCDIIDIVTPSGTHAEFALRAIAAGKHVVCEKPLALRPADADAVARAAAEAGVQLLVAHVARFTGPYGALKRAVDRGRVGAVAVARFERIAAAPAATSWYADDSVSGGVVGDLLVHDLDIARWVCGEVATVYCVSHRSTAPTDRLIGGAQAVLTHTSGAISRVSATWGHPGGEFRYGFSVAGPSGVIEYDSVDDPGLAVDVPSLEQTRTLRARALSRPNPYLQEIRHFAAVLRGEAPPRISPEDAVTAVVLSAAAATSIATGLPVTISTEGTHG